MSADAHGLEPFPLFVDSVSPIQSNHFLKMSALQVLSPSRASDLRKKQASAVGEFTDYLQLRYYQYECTFGLYCMTPAEKVILNTIVLSIFAAIFYAMYYGLQPFFVRSICHMLYYITGGIAGVEDICHEPSCSSSK